MTAQLVTDEVVMAIFQKSQARCTGPSSDRGASTAVAKTPRAYNGSRHSAPMEFERTIS